MEISSQEVLGVLREFNPWWVGKRFDGLPSWRRAAFKELDLWLRTPPVPRALLLSGARQVGKTTLLLQAAESLLAGGIPPRNILYATLDHPLLKVVGLDRLLRVWREYETVADGLEYLLIDEIQYGRDWQSWLKHQVDFQKNRRIAVTGSATPLLTEGQESGVGRWHTIKLATLSFYEYLQIKEVPPIPLPEVSSLQEFFSWKGTDFPSVAETGRPVIAHFHEYLVRGGFPQCATAPSAEIAQKLLREDIVDKVLKRDMTALFGIRRVLELEQTFLYLCMHDGGLLDVAGLCKELEVKKPTVNNFLAHLESAHLIYRLLPFGYGKEVLRGRYKVYLSDAAIAGSVMLKGRAMLDDPIAVSRAVETAFFKHVFTRYCNAGIGLSYWRGKKDEEVDIIADSGGRLVPFEVKYRRQHTGEGDLKGLTRFCVERRVSRAYVVTRNIEDFGVLPVASEPGIRVLKIPAALACYWLGRFEVDAASLPATEM